MSLPNGWSQPASRLERGHYFENDRSLCKHLERKPETILVKHEPRHPCWKCIRVLEGRRQFKVVTR